MELHETVVTIIQEFPYALLGSILVGTLCALLGVTVVAKRVVFLGAVLTQVSVFGLALTFLPFLEISHTVGSLTVTVVAVALLSRFLAARKVPPDAVLGMVFVGAIGLRILVMQKAPKVEASEIENLLRGDILFVTPELFYLMLAVFILAMTIQLLFFKEFRYVGFDAETARTQGFRSHFWEMLFYVIAAVVISVATHMVGDIFVFGFLVIPPMAAMMVARTVRGIFVVAALIGLVVPAVGLVLAFLGDVPASPAIVAVALLILGAARLFAAVRGS